MRHSCGGMRGWLVVVAMGIVGAQSAPAFAQDNAKAAGSPAEILKKLVEVNEAWLNPKPERLSYVLTATLREQPNSVSRVWIDGAKIRWEMEQNGDDGIDYTLVIQGNSGVYLKGPEQILNKKGSAGDARTFRQGITWRTAVHAIRERGVPSDAILVETKKVDGRDVAVVEMSLPDQRLNVGLGLRHRWLGQVQMPIGKVRLHVRMPEHIPVLEEYLEKDARVHYGETPLQLGESFAPSSITYSGLLRDGKTWELTGQFKKHDSLWLLDTATNKQDGKVLTALEVSDVSTAAPDKKLFDVPAK